MAKAKPKWVVQTQEEVAAFFGVSARTVRQWRAAWESEGVSWWKAGRDKQSYPLDAIAQWRIAQTQPRRPAAAPRPTAADDGQPPLERFRAARADLAEMERDRQLGAMVERVVIEEVMATTARTIRHGVERCCKGCQKVMVEALEAGLRELDRCIDAAERTRNGD